MYWTCLKRLTFINVQNVRLMQLPSTHISPIFRVCIIVVDRELHNTCLNNLVVLLKAAMTFEILAFSTLKIVQKRGHHSENMEKLQFIYNKNKKNRQFLKTKSKKQIIIERRIMSLKKYINISVNFVQFVIGFDIS